MIGVEEQSKLPVLLFLLENNKFQQIIKSMLNPIVSNRLIKEYGNFPDEFSQYQERKIKNSLKNFTIKEVHLDVISFQILELRGNNHQKPRDYHDRLLRQILRRKLRTEIPSPSDRRVLWLQFTQVYTKKNFYQNLKELDLSTDFQISIQKDIRRTETTKEVRQKTKAVLQAYAIHNPFLGYTQGMNFIVAFILQNTFSEEEAFFIFKRIVEDLLPPDYYTNMDGIMADMRILFEILSLTHPKCYAKMKLISEDLGSNYISTLSFAFQWFVCLFTSGNIEKNISQTIWDYFLIEGKTVLFKAALAIFDFLEPFILRCQNFQQYMKIEKDVVPRITDKEHIRKRIQSIFLSQQILFLLKQKLTSEAKQDEQKHVVKRKKASIYNGGIEKQCNLRWNVCTHVLQKNTQDQQYYQNFTFRINKQIQIIPDYLQKIDNYYFKAQKNNPTYSSDKFCIGRIEHICRPSCDSITQDSYANKFSREKGERQIEVLKSTSEKEVQKKIRMKAAQKLNEAIQRKTGMHRSQSVLFMQRMVQNASLSSLIDFYDIDEMFQS